MRLSGPRAGPSRAGLGALRTAEGTVLVAEASGLVLWGLTSGLPGAGARAPWARVLTHVRDLCLQLSLVGMPRVSWRPSGGLSHILTTRLHLGSSPPSVKSTFWAHFWGKGVQEPGRQAGLSSARLAWTPIPLRQPPRALLPAFARPLQQRPPGSRLHPGPVMDTGPHARPRPRAYWSPGRI